MRKKEVKKMNIDKKSWIVIIAVLFSFPLFSQTSEEEIKKEVQVVQEYNPIISDAFKINEMPSENDDEVAPIVFDYKITGKTFLGTPEIVPLIPAKLSKAPMESLFPAYAYLYGGNYSLIGGGINYNILQEEKYALALKLGHESSFGKLKLENDEKVSAPFHETDGSFYMRHFFSDKTLGLDLKFDNFSYRYYGLNDIDRSASYIDKSSLPGNTYTGKQLLENDSQFFTNFGLNLGFMNRVTRSQLFNYNLNFGFNTVGNKWGFNENRVDFLADLNIPLGNSNSSLLLFSDVKYATSNFKLNKVPEPFEPTKKDQLLVRLNPALTINTGSTSLKIGLGFGYENAYNETEIYLNPDFIIKVNVIDEIIALEGGITGDIKPSYYDLVLKENPFIAPNTDVNTAFHGIDMFIGVVGNFSRTTSFAAKVNYISFIDEHFFINKAYTLLENDTLTQHYSNLFDVDYDDGTLLKVSGELKVDFEPDFNVILKGTYYKWDMDSLEYAWHKPQMELGIRANYYINESLGVFASANIIGERKAGLPTSIVTLKPVYDFNLGANYQHNKRWNFFAEFRNVALSSYYRWNGYPSHRFNGRVGVGYSF